MYVRSDTLPLISKFDIDDQEHRCQYNPEGSHNYQHNKYCKVHPCVLNSETLIIGLSRGREESNIRQGRIGKNMIDLPAGWQIEDSSPGNKLFRSSQQLLGPDLRL